MAFDEQLRRVLDQALAELTEVARADAERAREQGVETGRAQGLQEGRAQGLQEGRAQGLFEAQEAARQEAAEQETESGLDRLVDGFRVIDRAGSLSEILDTVAACAGREAPRAATLLVRDGRVRGWRFIGFDPSFDTAAEINLSEAGVIADAIATGAAAGSDALPHFMQPAGGQSFAQPLNVAGTTVAALYADGFDDNAKADGIEQRLEALARHASSALEGLTALKAASTLLQVT